VESVFTIAGIRRESARVPPRLLAAVSDSTTFDIDDYFPKSLLAQENEAGD